MREIGQDITDSLTGKGLYYDLLDLSIRKSSDIYKGFREKRIESAFLSTYEYFSYKNLSEVTALFVAFSEDTLGDPIVLLVNKGHTYKKLNDIIGHKLYHSSNVVGDLHLKWLTVELTKANISTSMVKSSRSLTPFQTVNNVFFDSKAIALVKLSDYKIIADMNRQVAEKVQVFQKSKNLFYTIFVSRSSLPPKRMNHIRDGIEEISGHPKQQDLFRMLNIAGLQRYEEVDLSYIKQLIETYNGSFK